MHSLNTLHRPHTRKRPTPFPQRGCQTGLSGYAPYTAAKAGLQGFVKTAAVELAKHKISINTVGARLA